MTSALPRQGSLNGTMSYSQDGAIVVESSSQRPTYRRMLGSDDFVLANASTQGGSITRTGRVLSSSNATAYNVGSYNTDGAVLVSESTSQPIRRSASPSTNMYPVGSSYSRGALSGMRTASGYSRAGEYVSSSGTLVGGTSSFVGGDSSVRFPRQSSEVTYGGGRYWGKGRALEAVESTYVDKMSVEIDVDVDNFREIVEVPIEKIVHVEVEKRVSVPQIVEVPVERYSEKVITVPAIIERDVPVQELVEKVITVPEIYEFARVVFVGDNKATLP
jgi:hypothetical protein